MKSNNRFPVGSLWRGLHAAGPPVERPGGEAPRPHRGYLGESMKALPVEPSHAHVAIGSRIRAARQAQRLTIEQVADSTGLTKGFLSRIERDLTSRP